MGRMKFMLFRWHLKAEKSKKAQWATVEDEGERLQRER